jgi:hypothetical protein
MRFSSSTPLSDGQTSAASIGGGVAGACIILAVILGLLCFYVIRRKGSKTQAQGETNGVTVFDNDYCSDIAFISRSVATTNEEQEGSLHARIQQSLEMESVGDSTYDYVVATSIVNCTYLPGDEKV